MSRRPKSTHHGSITRNGERNQRNQQRDLTRLADQVEEAQAISAAIRTNVPAAAIGLASKIDRGQA